MLFLRSHPRKQNSQYILLLGLVVLVALHLLLQFAIPPMGDEAYFISWGKVLSLGYYDHPGAPGWLSYLLWNLNNLTGSDALISLHRISLILLETTSLCVFYAYLRLHRGARNSLSIILLLVSLPAHIIIFSVYLNDSLLAIFLFQFFLCTGFSWHFQNQPSKAYVFALLAGLFMGLAFLTKYTTIVYYGALFMSLLVTREKRRFLLSKYLLTSVIGFSLLGINLYWNYYNCQINLVFNFLLRNPGSVTRGSLDLLFSLLFLLGPLWVLIKNHKKEIMGNKEGLFSHFFISTLIIFSIAAVVRGSFGLHWGVGIIFIAVLAIAEVVNPDDFHPSKATAWNLGYSSLIIVPIICIFFFIKLYGITPIHNIMNEKQEYRVNQILDISDGSLVKDIRDKFPEDIIVSTTLYELAGMLDIAGVKNTRFMFTTSKYGRSHDIWYDYRELDSRNILFLPNEPNKIPEKLAAHFETLEKVTLHGNKASYNAFLGHNFNYRVYQDSTLNPVINKLYNLVPSLQGSCYMDKYR